MLGMYAIILYFAWYTFASAVIMKDQWHYLTMLTEYYKNGFSPSILLLSHGDHLLLGYNVIFFLNGIWGGLNTRLELFIGLLILGASAMALFSLFAASLDKNQTLSSKLIKFIPLLLILFSFHQTESSAFRHSASFTYSLLSVVAFSSQFLMFLFLRAFDGLLSGPRASMAGLVAMTGILLLLYLGFSGGGYVLHFGAAVICLLYGGLICRKNGRQLLPVSLALLFAGAAAWFAYSRLSVDNARFPFDPTYVFAHPGQSFAFVLTLLANSFFDVIWLANHGYPPLVTQAIGFLILALYGVAFFIFYKKKLWEKTIAPLYLMVLLGGAASALLIARLPVTGIGNAMAVRYITLLQFGLLGLVWILILWFECLTGSRKKLAWLLLIGFTTFPYVFHLCHAASVAQQLRNLRIEYANQVLNGELQHPSFYRHPTRHSAMGLRTLQEHKLNVFADPYYYRALKGQNETGG